MSASNNEEAVNTKLFIKQGFWYDVAEFFYNMLWQPIAFSLENWSVQRTNKWCQQQLKLIEQRERLHTEVP